MLDDTRDAKTRYMDSLLPNTNMSEFRDVFYAANTKEFLSATCSVGDLLIADVRMLHRDSPCKEDFRVALHCYLGLPKTNHPKIVLN